MTASPVEAEYTLKRIQEMLGLSRAVVTGLIEAGFVTPTAGRGRERRFSFQDLMLLRTAYELQQAKIPPRKILRSLAKLRSELPAELPLTGLRITAVGADVAVRDRSGSWHADSGQLLMDFEVGAETGTISFLRSTDARRAQSSKEWFDEAASLEASDIKGAEAAYRRAIALEPTLSNAYLNLGALLCESARPVDALALYDEAMKHVADDPRIHFNRAIALEDQTRFVEALAAYGEALALDASFEDAHYNSGVLLEKSGDEQGALRHFSAYRRLHRGT